MFTHQIHNPKEVNSSVMKTLIILVLIGSAMLCLQPKPEKSSTYGSPKGGSVPAVEAGKENEVTNDPNSSRDDERNDSYGSYDNPAGSSTDTHRGYPDDRRPPPLNQGEK
ncbi:hypothetical protein Acr_00g0013500 [Actinidia rufa]|uniref:Uncharacterized protein n=1 Tax=Actinidia rufa TaxID=165716 RepID=A0A7J0DA01_9ERIC|nr:hypothetical protein Acr_00g0013500 [Actinidia rufa]